MENGTEVVEDNRKASTGSMPKPNIKELTHKQRNWFSSFEKSRTTSNGSPVAPGGLPASNEASSSSGVESIDSVRRTSVKNEHTPQTIGGNGVDKLESPKSLPPDATPTPPSSLNLPRDRRPLSARGSNNSDSIEDYIRNWKKDGSVNGTSPLPSPGIDSLR